MPRRVVFSPGFYLSETTAVENEDLVPKGSTPVNPINPSNSCPSNVSATNFSMMSGGLPMTSSGATKIDMNRFRELLHSLRPLSETQLNLLSPQARDNFRQVAAYIDLLYDTEYYTIISNEVARIFDLKTVTPGTVGAFFAGRRVAKEITNSPIDIRCLPISSGSMPLPKSEQQISNCNYTVILGKRNMSGKLDFLVLSRVKDTTRALLFLPGTTSSSINLTELEKMELAQLGVSEVKILGYSDNNYLDLTNWVAINRIPTAGVVNGSMVQNVKRQINSLPAVNTTTLIIIIILVVLLIIGIWYLMTSNRY